MPGVDSSGDPCTEADGIPTEWQMPKIIVPWECGEDTSASFVIQSEGFFVEGTVKYDVDDDTGTQKLHLTIIEDGIEDYLCGCHFTPITLTKIGDCVECEAF